MTLITQYDLWVSCSIFVCFLCPSAMSSVVVYMERTCTAFGYFSREPADYFMRHCRLQTGFEHCRDSVPHQTNTDHEVNRYSLLTKYSRHTFPFSIYHINDPENTLTHTKIQRITESSCTHCPNPKILNAFPPLTAFFSASPHPLTSLIASKFSTTLFHFTCPFNGGKNG